MGPHPDSALVRRPVDPTASPIDYLGTTMFEFADAGPVPTALTALTKNWTNNAGSVKVYVTARAVGPTIARTGAPTGWAFPPFWSIRWANTW